MTSIDEVSFAGDMVEREWRARARRDDVTAQLTGLRKAAAHLKDQQEKTPSEKAQAEYADTCAMIQKAETELSDLDKIIAQEEKPRLETAAKVRAILRHAGVATGEQIQELGCTGLVKLLAGDDASIEEAISSAQFVLSNMGGSGYGLTCYVPLNKFCLVHNIEGGLQESQEPRYADMFEHTTRELTAEEKGHVNLVEAARRADSRAKAKDLLGGRVKEDDLVDALSPVTSWEERGDATPVTSPASPHDEEAVKVDKMREVLSPLGLSSEAVARAIRAALYPADELSTEEAFRCPEHDSLVWQCRFCVAALVAEESLDPAFVLIDDEDQEFVEGSGVDDALEDVSIDSLTVYVRAATYERKLTKV